MLLEQWEDVAFGSAVSADGLDMWQVEEEEVLVLNIVEVVDWEGLRSMLLGYRIQELAVCVTRKCANALSVGGCGAMLCVSRNIWWWNRNRRRFGEAEPEEYCIQHILA